MIKLTSEQMEEFLKLHEESTMIDEWEECDRQSRAIAPQAVRELMEARELLRNIYNYDPKIAVLLPAVYRKQIEQYLGE
jgi:hypothetical protein